MKTTVDIAEVQEQLSRLLDLARAGNEVIIAEGDTPVARLTAIPAPKKNGERRRVAGLHRGVAEISPDFDEPLPDEFWMGANENPA